MAGANSGGGAAERLQCNGCWSAVDCKEHSVVTTCHHLYCLNCTQLIMDSDDAGCPICQQVRCAAASCRAAAAVARGMLRSNQNRLHSCSWSFLLVAA